MKKVQGVVLGILIIIIGCTEKSKLPKDVYYGIIKESFIKTYHKADIYVRLNKPVDEDILSLIAKEIKAERPEADNYMISYYLQDQSVNSQAWAITNYNPEPYIKILGRTQAVINKVNKIERLGELELGRWYEDTPPNNRNIIIYNEKGQYKIRSIYNDGSGGVKPLTHKVVKGEVRYYEKFESPNRYYTIEDGVLCDFSDNFLYMAMKGK